MIRYGTDEKYLFIQCTVQKMLWIRIDFNADADPDPALHLKADPDQNPGSQTNADPDPVEPNQCGSGSTTLI
jgi:hypothetical protein